MPGEVLRGATKTAILSGIKKGAWRRETAVKGDTPTTDTQLCLVVAIKQIESFRFG